MMKLITTIVSLLILQDLFAQYLPLTNQPTTYVSVTDGNWSSTSTWKNGNVPPSTINYNSKVVIKNTVTYNLQNDLDIRKGSVEIFEGELKFPTSGSGNGKSLFIRDDGKLVVNAGKLILPLKNSSGGNNSGNLINESGKIEIYNSTVEVAQNWQAKDYGDHKIVSSCIKVGENYQNISCTEILDRSCIELGLQGSGNFDNDKGDIRMNLSSILLRGTSGNFKNKTSTSKIRKYGDAVIAFSALDVPGDLENEAIWDAPIDKYCVGQNIQGNRAWDIDFTAPENCTVVNTSHCDCSGNQFSEQGAQFNYLLANCEPDICSYPIAYFFDTLVNGTSLIWPDVNGFLTSGKVTVAGHNYTEAEGRAIFNTPNTNGIMLDSKNGFLTVATLKLSKTNYVLSPSLLVSVTTIETWLATCGKLSPTNLPTNNPAVLSAANYLQQWINTHGCEDRR